MPKIIVKDNKLRNIAITDIKTVEDFYFCAKYCEMSDDFFDMVNQGHIDKNVAKGDTVCYDDGSKMENFYFWGEYQHSNSKGCKHFTVEEFKEYVKELEKENGKMNKRYETEFKVDEVVVSEKGVVSLYKEGMKSDNLKRWEPVAEESYYVFWSSFKEIRIAKFSHMEDCKYVDENHFAYKYCMPIGLFDCKYNFKGE